MLSNSWELFKVVWSFPLENYHINVSILFYGEAKLDIKNKKITQWMIVSAAYFNPYSAVISSSFYFIND